MSLTVCPNTSIDELFDNLELIREPAEQSNYIGVTNPHCPEEILTGFAAADNPEVRSRLAENPSTPVWLLMKLSVDIDTEVRAAVGENSRTPDLLLWALARDESCDVRYSLAENHRLSAAILKFLCEDENPFVSIRAQKTCAAISRSAQLGSVIGMPAFFWSESKCKWTK